MKQRKNCFTLIEMLAVAAIASVLIALITPAVQKMLFGSRVDQCASNLKLAMEQAQSKAVASRKYVALILPGDRNAASENLKKFCKSGYRLAYVKKEGSDFHFVSWVPGSSWKNPNDGAMMLAIVDTAPTAAPEAPGISDKFTKLEDLKSDGSIAADPDKGTEAKAGDEDIGALGSMEKCALVFSPYGGMANNDTTLYFVFTESKVEGDEYVLDNPDNFLVLKLNAVTGRVTYFDPFGE